MSKGIILFLIILSIACSDKNENPFVNLDGISDEAEKYFDAAVDTMRTYSINKYSIDWNSIKVEAFEGTYYAQTTADTYDAIRYVLENSDEVPGFLREPEDMTSLLKSGFHPILPDASPANTNNSLLAVRLGNRIGYIRIPYFNDAGQAVENYPYVVRDLIKSIDAESVDAWILDLRECFSGNIWHMIAGISPILGEGLAGRFVDADNNAYSWSIENDQVKIDDITAFAYDNPYQLYTPNPFVAVLTDSMTASSGEAVAISFKGREKARSFGNSTYGFSILRGGYSLSDGALIYFTVYEMADRINNRYGYRVEPDIRILGERKEFPTNNDIVVDAAIEWLESNL